MSAIVNIVLLLVGGAIVLGLGGGDKVSGFIDSLRRAGSGVVTTSRNVGELAPDSQEKVNDLLAALDGSGQTLQSAVPDFDGGLVSVLVGNEIIQVPFEDVATISPANVQTKEQLLEIQRRIDAGDLFLTEQELLDIQRLDERAGGNPLKFEGIETVVAKQIEEEKAFQILIDSGATFFGTGDSGRPKLFADPLFEFGGLTKEQFDAQQRALAEFDQEVSKVTGLTREESNLLGEESRLERAIIEQQIVSSGGFNEEAAKQFLLDNNASVSGSLSEKQFATILQVLTLENPF